MDWHLSKKKIYIGCSILIIIGAYLLGYFHILYDLVFHGKFPTPTETGIAIGNLLLFAGLWGLKLRKYVEKSVS